MKIGIGLLITFLMLSVINAEAFTKEEFTKRFHEEYTADVNTILKIKNKFGDVNLEDWDKDQVVIDVTITVKTESEDKANRIFDRITISIDKDGNLISAITEIDDKINNSGKFSIDYSLKVPQYIILDLANKFGNVFINDLSGKVNIYVGYGSLMINSLSRADEDPLNEIDLAYCNKASISEVAKAKVIIKYSKIDILNSEKLLLYSKYSKVKIEKVNALISEAAYDTYKIDEVVDFSSIGKYCDYSLNKIMNSIDVEIKYGNLTVAYVSPEFESIKSYSKYGQVRLGIAENASYRIDAEVEYGGIEHPNSDNLSRIKDNTGTELKGVIGSSKSKSFVEINAKYGSVNLIR